MSGRKTQSRKAYAVIDARGRIVRDEGNLQSLMLFDTKWRAENAIWKPSERVVRVIIAPTPDEKERM